MQYPVYEKNKSYLQGWNFRMNTFWETYATFDQMGIAEQVYTG